ncbi:MAG: lipoyl synthase [Veillonellales bacterium]
MEAVRPEWLKIKSPDAAKMQQIKMLMDRLDLHTVCESAQCPNVGECFGHQTATFMILGDVCTRNCRFCAVHHGIPGRPDPAEPDNLAEAVQTLGLKYIVITSVTRDDLPDGGAGHYAAVLQSVYHKVPDAAIEVLIPDLAGSEAALAVVVAARPSVLNHNVETVPALYSRVRPEADYQRSVDLFATVKKIDPKMITKSGMMLGLGESVGEVTKVMEDLNRAGCDILTLGQYLRPSAAHIPMERYVTPKEFEEYRRIGLKIGFKVVVANPLVRSSYYAREAYQQVLAGSRRQ